MLSPGQANLLSGTFELGQPLILESLGRCSIGTSQVQSLLIQLVQTLFLVQVVQILLANVDVDVIEWIMPAMAVGHTGNAFVWV